MYKFIFSLLLFLFPFHDFSISVGTTKFDIYPVFVFLFLFFYLLFKMKINKQMIYVFVIFSFISFFCLLYFKYSNFYRFTSAFFWMSILICTYFYSNRFYSNSFILFLKIIGWVIASTIIIQFYLNPDERPKFFFSEPSSAGLVMYSYLVFYIFKIYLDRNSSLLLNISSFIIFLIAGFLTKASHFSVVFLIPIFYLFYNFSYSKLKVILPIILLLSILFFYFIFSNDYFINRLDFRIDVQNYNLSQLAWLRGFDQAFYVFMNSPLVGFGPGSTGMFQFYSVYSDILDKSAYPDLNLFNAYSLFFRLIIEIGFLNLFILIYFLFRKFKIEEKNLIDNKLLLNRYLMFIFGVTLFVGSLIKEPNYAFSPLFLSIITMGFYRFNDERTI